MGVLRLKKRAEFLRVAAVRRKWAVPGMVVQAAAQKDQAACGSMRVGFTATKKVGNAVVRNRIKRRLRAVAAEILPVYGNCGWDYVLIGRKNTLERPFEKLKEDLRQALAKLGATPTSKTGLREIR